MAVVDSVTVTITETVTHEMTCGRLAELLDIPVEAVPGLLKDVDQWRAAGLIEDAGNLLDQIDYNTYRAGENRSWTVRADIATGPVPVAPVIVDRGEIAADSLADAAATASVARVQ